MSIVGILLIIGVLVAFVGFIGLLLESGATPRLRGESILETVLNIWTLLVVGVFAIGGALVAIWQRVCRAEVAK